MEFGKGRRGAFAFGIPPEAFIGWPEEEEVGIGLPYVRGAHIRHPVFVAGLFLFLTGRVKDAVIFLAQYETAARIAQVGEVAH